MEDFNSKMMEVTKGLTMYNEKMVSICPDFKDQFINRISMAASKIYQILLGYELPMQTTGGDKVKWNRVQQYLVHPLHQDERWGLNFGKTIQGKNPRGWSWGLPSGMEATAGKILWRQQLQPSNGLRGAHRDKNGPQTRPG